MIQLKTKHGSIWINSALIRYVEASKYNAEHTKIVFDTDHYIIVEESVSNVLYAMR